MPQIIDAIKTTSELYGTHFYLVLDKEPEFLYERRNQNLVASDDGFYSCYHYEQPKHSRAFAGREFDIPLKDGPVIKANGQWWDGGHRKNAPEPITSIGYKTIEGLNRCYVFIAGHISTEKLNAWLNENEPSSDYHKYDKRQAAQVAIG